MILGEKLGEGRTSEVRAFGPGRIVKLYHPHVPEADIAREYAAARHAGAIGLPCPATHERVVIDGRSGMVQDRIDGPSLIGAMLTGAIDFGGSVEVFATTHRLVNAVAAPGFRPLGDVLATAAAAIPRTAFEAEEWRMLERRLAELPAGDRACHLDYHIDNTLLVGDRCEVIDWAVAARGPAEMDFAYTSLIMEMGELPPGMTEELMQRLQALRLAFVEAYRGRYLGLARMREADVAPWRLPAMVFRLGNWALASERALLVGRIRAELARPA